MGRPYKNVDARVIKAKALIASGMSERKACKEARICRTTFHVRTGKYYRDDAHLTPTAPMRSELTEAEREPGAGGLEGGMPS